MSDYIIRGMAADKQVRFFAANTKDLVEKARRIHNTSPIATAALGRLMTGTAMMGSMCKNDSDIVTVQIKGDGPMRGLVVTSDTIIFLRKIIKGSADKSYGIQVAKLAGVPEVVIERAKEIAAELEESDITANTKNIGKKHTEEVEPVQISLFDTMGMVAEQPKKSEVEETLKKLDISNMTPMEAMNQLYELQKKCK